MYIIITVSINLSVSDRKSCVTKQVKHWYDYVDIISAYLTDAVDTHVERVRPTLCSIYHFVLQQIVGGASRGATVQLTGILDTN